MFDMHLPCAFMRAQSQVFGSRLESSPAVSMTVVVRERNRVPAYAPVHGLPSLMSHCKRDDRRLPRGLAGAVDYPGFLQKHWFSEHNAGRLRAHIRDVRLIPPPLLPLQLALVLRTAL